MALNAHDLAYNEGITASVKEAEKMQKCLSMAGNKSGSKTFIEFQAYLESLKKV